ncbi:MAG: galactokinase [Chitinophagales bacterium]|nr:galactokinase [Chitinophagales bacterium]
MKTLLSNLFQKTFNAQAEVWVQAPTRINLIGEHTDYNGGLVLPAAINHYISFAARKTSSEFANIVDYNTKKSVAIELEGALDLDKLSAWQKYYYGAIKLLMQKYKIGGFQILKYGQVPVGAGVSSSAALCCGLIYTISELYELGISREKIAKLAQQVEHDYLGLHCGIMDQYAVMFGQKDSFLELDCSSLKLKQHPVNLGAYQLVLCNTMVKHSLAGSAYNDRVEEVELALSILKVQNVFYSYASEVRESDLLLIQDDVLRDRVAHVIEENSRVEEMVLAMQEARYETIGKLLSASHASLRDQYQVSCKESDFLAEHLEAAGALGARQMGGGFGGCLLFLVEKTKLEALKSEVEKAYAKVFHKIPEFYDLAIVDGVNTL